MRGMQLPEIRHVRRGLTRSPVLVTVARLLSYLTFNPAKAGSAAANSSSALAGSGWAAVHSTNAGRSQNSGLAEKRPPPPPAAVPSVARNSCIMKKVQPLRLRLHQRSLLSINQELGACMPMPMVKRTLTWMGDADLGGTLPAESAVALSWRPSTTGKSAPNAEDMVSMSAPAPRRDAFAALHEDSAATLAPSTIRSAHVMSVIPDQHSTSEVAAHRYYA